MLRARSCEVPDRVDPVRDEFVDPDALIGISRRRTLVRVRLGFVPRLFLCEPSVDECGLTVNCAMAKFDRESSVSIASLPVLYGYHDAPGYRKPEWLRAVLLKS